MSLQAFYQFASSYPCIVCQAGGVELHHVNGGVGLRKHTALARRSGAAIALVVPLCAQHHRMHSESVHSLGEPTFELHHGLPDGFLIRYAATLLAAFVAAE